MTTAERLYEEAQALPPAEREALGLRLLESAGPPGRDIDDPWWQDEIARRVADMQSGTAESITVEELMERARAVVRARK